MVSLLEIFWAFFKVGALAFGGAYAAMPLIEQQIVNTGWMTFQEFSDLIAIDELTPGPIIINSATFIGMKLHGVPGAVTATIACILPACIVSITLIKLYEKYNKLPLITEMMNCLKSMSVAMVFSTALKVAMTAIFPQGFVTPLTIDWFAIVMIGVSFFLLKKYNPNPIYIMLGCGAISLALSFMGLA